MCERECVCICERKTVCVCVALPCGPMVASCSVWHCNFKTKFFEIQFHTFSNNFCRNIFAKKLFVKSLFGATELLKSNDTECTYRLVWSCV